MQTNTHKALCKLLQGDYRTETSEQLVKRVDGMVQALRAERNDLQSQLAEITKVLVENGLMKRNVNSTIQYLITVAKNHEKLVGDAADLRTQRDALYERLTQVVAVTGEPTLEELVESLISERGEAFTTDRMPRIHDKRYIVHGDIQPCVVLYSDETTTLVRLDENDMMCETDTIEWSDELTYRCQELLRTATDCVVSRKYSDALAALVRDERVTLNDEGSDHA